MRNYQSKSNLGSLPDSITSTRFGAGEFNSLATENENAVTTSGQTLAAADGTGEVSNQLARALAIYGAGGAAYHLDTGAVNAYVLTPVSPKESPNAYFNGFSVVFEPGTVNTTASTVNVGGLGVKSITLQNGTALSGGEISGTCCLKYNLGDDRFELIYSSDSFLSISNYYEIDSSQADQGATSTNPNTMTIYDVATLVGTSKFATIHLSHNPAAGNQTYYTFDTSLDLTTYPLLHFVIDPGAQFNRTTGDEVLTFHSPSKLSVSTTQQLTSVDMLVFNYGGDIYPEWWGASSRDSSDDLNAFQYAINSIQNGNPGGTLKLKSGIYRLSSYIEIEEDGIRMEGAFPGWFNEFDSTVIRMTTANTTVIYAHGAGTGTRIKNLSFKNFLIQYGTGSGDDTNTSGVGIDLQYILYSEISNVRFNNIQTGIKLTECIDLVIEKIFYQRLYAVPAGSSYGIYADGNTGTGNASITVRDSIITFLNGAHTGTAYGIYSSGTIVQDYTIENVELGRCDVGIYFEATGTYKFDIKIHAVICDIIFGYGIQMVDFGDTGMSQITGSYFASASGATGTFAGVNLQGVTGVTVADNQFLGYTDISETGNYGILINSDTQYCNVVNNQFRNQYIPIGISNGSKNNISGNIFFNDSTHTAGKTIYLVNGAANVINGNVIGGYSTVGIDLGASSSTTQIKNNEITGANITTKLSDAGSGNLIQGNTGWITENSGTSSAIATGGTIAHGLSTTPTVVNLTSTDTGVTAIYWSANATNITVNYTGGGSHAFHWEAKVR